MDAADRISIHENDYDLGIKLAGLREILEARVGIEPSSPVQTRKLFILHSDKNYKNDRIAGVRYTGGTWETSLAPLEFRRFPADFVGETFSIGKIIPFNNASLIM